MKKVLIAAVAVSSILFAAGHAAASWDTNDTYKMHWPQLPDLTQQGMDVNATVPFILADDFMCQQSGPITAIHIWGSWRLDQDDPAPIFILSIHSDIPAGVGQPYSMPGTTLWYRAFLPGEYEVRIYATNLNEGWLDPPANYTPSADTICYQYNFSINSEEAFYQTNETIYWLDVQVVPSAEGVYYFGWKTADPALRWNDDACWTSGSEPDPSGWTNLVYPPGHPLEGQTLDLAFVIQGEALRTNALCPKWIQPPDCDRGLDVESWSLTVVTQATPIVADDWLCDGRPVHAVRWWGSYSGWQTNSAGPVTPPASPRPLGFRLTWYRDIPAWGTNFSHPGEMITNCYYELSPFGSTNRNQVLEQYYCSSRLDFVSTNAWEHEFSYFMQFTNSPWLEKQGKVYWLSIEAIYPSAPTQYLWGWKTTSPQWNWNDDAVEMRDLPNWNEMTYPPPGWEWVTNHPYAGLSVNMAFELLTEICPSRCIKWQQPPDMTTGLNMPSYATNGVTVELRADDFVSDGRPITDIHWWGSYLGWVTDTPGTNDIPPPSGANAPMGFRLSWHLNDPTNNLPGAALTNIYVALSNCHEVYYGTVTQFWHTPETYEHEYQYYVDLLDVGVDSSSWMETNGVRYWLNIQAIFSSNWVPTQVHSGWGWKTTPQPTGAYSAVSRDGVQWTNDVIADPTHPNAGTNFDLAFELTTTNLPLTNRIINAVFTNIFLTNFPGEVYLWSTGYCGCGKQILQVSSDLVSGAWADVYTNPAPRSENLWRGQSGSPHVFYRVLQKQ